MDKQGGIYARYSPGRNRDQTLTIEADIRLQSQPLPKFPDVTTF